MKLKQAYIGQPVALARSPNLMLGTVIGIRKKMVEVKLNGNTGTQKYGAKVLAAYKGGK